MNEQVEQLLKAAQDLTTARKRLKKCVAQAGYEAGYFCHDQRQAASEAEASYERAFIAAVRFAAWGEGGTR